MQDYFPVTSYQYAIDYKFISDLVNITTGIYYKKERQYEYDQTDFTIYEVPRKLLGFEISLNKSIGAFNIQTSYSFLNARKYIKDQWVNSENKMNYMVKGCLNYLNNAIGNFNVNYIGYSGRFYTPVVRGDYNEENQTYLPVFGSYNSQQYNNYNKLDLSYNKILFIKKMQTVFFITLSNLFNFKNQRNVDYLPDYSGISDFNYYQNRTLYFGAQISW